MIFTPDYRKNTITRYRITAEKRKILHDDYYIQMAQKMDKEMSDMCNLGKDVMEKCIAQGLSKGRAEGKAEGILSSIKGTCKEHECIL